MITEKYLLLDVGDTLVSIDEPFEKYTALAIENVLVSMGISSKNYIDKFVEYRNELRKEAHSTLKEFSINFFLEESFRSILNTELDSKKSIELERIYIQAEIDITTIFDDTINFLKKAVSMNREIYLTTNNFSYQHVHALIEKFGLNDYLSGVHISVECGFRKPSRNFLEKFFDKFPISSDMAVIIGDKYAMDIVCGKQYGIKTGYINRKKVLAGGDLEIPDYNYSSLREIEFSVL